MSKKILGYVLCTITKEQSVPLVWGTGQGSDSGISSFNRSDAYVFSSKREAENYVAENIYMGEFYGKPPDEITIVELIL
jgi:hypothetical protein